MKGLSRILLESGPRDGSEGIRFEKGKQAQEHKQKIRSLPDTD